MSQSSSGGKKIGKKKRGRRGFKRAWKKEDDSCQVDESHRGNKQRGKSSQRKQKKRLARITRERKTSRAGQEKEQGGTALITSSKGDRIMRGMKLARVSGGYNRGEGGMK